MPHRAPGSLGLALAELGLRDEAVAAGRRGVELLDVADDALWGGNTLWRLAQIRARLCDPDEAIDLIETLRSAPGMSGHVSQLELDPLFGPIRSDARYRELVERPRGAARG